MTIAELTELASATDDVSPDGGPWEVLLINLLRAVTGDEIDPISMSLMIHIAINEYEAATVRHAAGG